MKNWQDYATDANTNCSRLQPPRNQNLPLARPTKSNTPKKTWLCCNITLTALCGVAILFGLINTVAAIIHTKTSLNVFSTFAGNTGAILLAPAYFYIALTNINSSELFTVSFLTLVFSVILGIGLLINAVCAFTSFLKNRKKYPRHATLNLIFAIIPPAFVLIVLILVYYFA